MAIKEYRKDYKTQLSANFKANEFACKGKGCCSKVLIDEKLVKYLQQIRNHFDKPVTLNSAYRCAKHNKAVGGASSSNHTKGMAADIVVQGVKPAEVAKYAETIGILGIGLYEAKDGNFVHIDTRTSKSFWYGHSQAKRTTFGGSQPVKKAYSGKFPNVKVAYYTTNSKGKKVKKYRYYLKKGDMGQQVGYLQAFLNWCVSAKIDVDNDFGANTEKAVAKFQSVYGLTVDKLFGETCLAKAKTIKK